MNLHLYAKLNPNMDARWYNTVTEALEDYTCCDCDQPATRITDASKHHDGSVKWAHCQDCAFESRAESVVASRA